VPNAILEGKLGRNASAACRNKVNHPIKTLPEKSKGYLDVYAVNRFVERISLHRESVLDRCCLMLRILDVSQIFKRTGVELHIFYEHDRTNLNLLTFRYDLT
jgi:hypothetical protein